MKLTPLVMLVSGAVATVLSGAPMASVAASASAETFGLSLAQSETPSRWFIELAGPPVVRGVTPSAVAAERANFRAAASAAGIAFTDRYEFQTLWNGVSIEAGAEAAAKLRALPGVKAVYPVVDIEAPPSPDAGAIADVASAIAQTRSDEARDVLGLTGAGIKVAIIDTGIDYDHPDLGGCFGPGCKVAYGYDFVGDTYNAGDPVNNTPIPDPDPDDCNGHGTHVAGIVGASAAESDGVTGVAPKVTLGAYRVFGCEGSSTADVLVAALERAYADGMQVVNQSLGAAFQWPEYPTAVVGDALVEAGVVVVASAGNSGATGTFSGGAPAIGRDVIGVASFDNIGIRATYFEAGGQNIDYRTITLSAAPPTSGTEEIVYVGRGCDDDSYLADPNGKAALIVRGTCTFAEKAQKAVDEGATAVVIYNNVAGIFQGTLGDPPSYTVPVVGISEADGLFLLGLTPPIEIAWSVDVVPNPTGDLISSFSSWGLSPDLALKPDLGAPGGGIYATYPLEAGGYATLSGTSMSAPHVAGAVALLLEARPGVPAGEVREILQNTSVPKVWSENPSLGSLEPAHRQGAGMIDIVEAITGDIQVSPGKISLGESEAGSQVTRLTLRNRGSEDVTLTAGAMQSITTTRAIAASGTANAPSGLSLEYSFDGVGVGFSAPEVTVPAGGVAIFDVEITVLGVPPDRLYGGYVILTPESGAPIVVPFGGYAGDYQAIQPLDGFNNNSIFPSLPSLAKLDGFFYSNQPDGATYTLVDGDLPYFLVHLGHPVQRLALEIVDAASGLRVHPVFANALEFDYFGRNSTRTQFFDLPWDGTRIHSAGNDDLFKVVPNGEYKVNVKALKALGDASNPDDWQVWTSPTITIARPEEPKKTVNLHGRGR
jgi:subtilisin family serine protease